MKLVLNTWLAFQTEGAAEAADLAERLGISIADRWRQLVHDGSSGLDVSAAREGLGRAASADPTMPPSLDDRILEGGKPSRPPAPTAS
jgi:hypothetical protein